MNAITESAPLDAVATPNARAPKPVKILLDVIDRLGRLDGWIGGGCLLTLTGLMLSEIGTRLLSNISSFFPASISVAWEYSSYLMAACFTFGAAMTLRAGGHIRVTLLTKNLPAPLARLLEFATAALACGFVTFMAWAMARFTWTSYVRGLSSVTSETPVWFPQAVVTFGIVLLALQFLARAIQAALGLPLEDHGMRATPVE